MPTLQGRGFVEKASELVEQQSGASFALDGCEPPAVIGKALRERDALAFDSFLFTNRRHACLAFSTGMFAEAG
jgi:hypothetical protein